MSNALVDALTAIGDVVPPREQLDVILEGLLEDYESIVSLIISKFDPLSVNEVETLLLAREAHLDKFKKVVAFINVVEPSPSAPSSQAQTNVAQVSAIDQHVAPHFANTNNT
ncbi:hypothetical protein CR513_23187, partial [Mucuna pruriens]